MKTKPQFNNISNNCPVAFLNEPIKSTILKKEKNNNAEKIKESDLR